MMLADKQADRICALLKERNELTREYSRAEILAANYLCRFADDEVIAFVEVKKVQWYQSEVCHLTVALEHERQGHAKALIQEAEEIAILHRSRLLQCTIRENNVNSRMLFEYFGFRLVNQFYNQVRHNNVYVLQKVLVTTR
jgi:ribosomal protein S18 acetylase RimI-like enzyme